MVMVVSASLNTVVELVTVVLTGHMSLVNCFYWWW